MSRITSILLHSEPENLKKSRPKKLVKSNTKPISRNFFWPNFIFCDFKNDQKSIFEVGKSLKQPKMQFQEKKIGFTYFILRFFLPGLF